ncbi:TBC1 domain family member 20 [Lepeophtheirus salmonis]|uniref:TBC1 domain family member 20 n=1 Tax=Lepeophtheirus salmonis TaxID=72036 RepID=UPI001AE9158F|nr:TBC1 domain family member 20-like [Lepeophtheirus salmonis]
MVVHGVEESFLRNRRHISAVVAPDNEYPKKTKRNKVSQMEKYLLESNIDGLKFLAISEGGLVHDAHRRKVWPALLGITMLETLVPPTSEDILNHKDYHQVVMDVNRSLKRFPPCISDEQRPELQEQLTRIIIRVLGAHPELCYYQGYHDVAITFLLVVGEEMGFRILEKLSLSHLKPFMASTMEETSYFLQFMYPIIKRENSELFDFIEESDLGTIFSLPWVITWFGHVLNDYSDVVRLYDYFMVQPPEMSIYFATALVLFRSSEILERCERDMASIHSLLGRIPLRLPFEDLIKDSLRLYEKYNLKSLAKEVDQRIQRENDQINDRRKMISTMRHGRLGFKKLYLLKIVGKIALLSTPVILSALYYHFSS